MNPSNSSSRDYTLDASQEDGVRPVDRLVLQGDVQQRVLDLLQVGVRVLHLGHRASRPSARAAPPAPLRATLR